MAADEADGLRFGPLALAALQGAAEEFLVGALADGRALTEHRGRVTLQERDLRLGMNLRSQSMATHQLHRPD